MTRIALVEDDEAVRAELAELLTKNGYEPVSITDFGAVAQTLEHAECDLVLLDLNLPYQDGILISKEVASTIDVPIIVLTSRCGEIDEVMAIKMGASDFVAKPYSAHVLLARIEAQLRRSNKPLAHALSVGEVVLDTTLLEVQYRGKQIALSKNEARILRLLMTHATHCVCRQTIMCELWESDSFIDDNTLTVNINRLRQKLESIGIEGFLVTHRGRGYSVQ